jgi:hypothetical protein
MLESLLQRCEADTFRLLGPRAAQRLGNWRRHAAVSEQALIQFVQQLLWGEHCENGRKLDQQGGLSLERIVLEHCLEHCAELFSEPDLAQARRTLRI